MLAPDRLDTNGAPATRSDGRPGARPPAASRTLAQLDVDADPPYLVLHAADEKNRKASTIPLRVDLAADPWEWLDYKLATL